jgi:hypothetical protein
MFAFRRASYVIFRQSRQNLTIKSFTSVASKASRTHGELSLSAAIRSLTRAFTEGNIPEPELSAKYLVLHAWKGDSKSSLQDLDSAGANHVTLDREQQEVLEDLKLKRLQRLSVQHCVGTWDFHDITLRLTPPILVPRPETEVCTSQHVAIIITSTQSGLVCYWPIMRRRQQSSIAEISLVLSSMTVADFALFYDAGFRSSWRLC